MARNLVTGEYVGEDHRIGYGLPTGESRTSPSEPLTLTPQGEWLEPLPELEEIKLYGLWNGTKWWDRTGVVFATAHKGHALAQLISQQAQLRKGGYRLIGWSVVEMGMDGRPAECP